MVTDIPASASRAAKRVASAPVPMIRIESLFICETLLLVVEMLNKRFPFFIGHLNGMLFRRESVVLYIGDISFEGIIHLGMQVGIFADEFGREAVEQTQQIVRHQHLPVTTCASSNSDGGDGQSLRDHFGQPGWDGFEHQAEAPCFFKEKGILEQSLGS